MTGVMSTMADLIRMGHIDDVYNRLVDGHDIDSTMGKHKRTPLHLAVTFSQPKLVHMLLERGADIRIQDAYGHTPLHIAAIRGTADIIQMLVSANSPIGALDYKRRTAVHIVADNVMGSTDAVRILIAHATDDEVLALDYKCNMAKHYSGSREIALL